MAASNLFTSFCNQRREQLKLTHQAIADRMRLQGPELVAMFLSGFKLPPRNYCDLLADALEVPQEFLWNLRNVVEAERSGIKISIDFGDLLKEKKD